MFSKRWLQAVHMSFIIKFHLLHALSVGCVDWNRVIQDVVVLVLLTAIGCRIGELLLTVDYHPDTCATWNDFTIVFPGGVPDLSRAVLRFWIHHEKGVKGDANSWRDVTSSYLSIDGLAHMDTITMILTYAMRQERVTGTLDEIIRTAASNPDHAIHWRDGHQPFIHRWSAKKLFRVPLYDKPMDTNHYLLRFKEVCSSAGFGDQRIHASRRGAARDAKDTVTDAHLRDARAGAMLGHAKKSDALSRQYGLPKTNKEYNSRVDTALKKSGMTFDYSGYIGKGFDGEIDPKIMAKLTVPVDALKTITAKQHAKTKAEVFRFKNNTEWASLGKLDLKTACVERNFRIMSRDAKADFIQHLNDYDAGMYRDEGEPGGTGDGDGDGDGGEGVGDGEDEDEEEDVEEDVVVTAGSMAVTMKQLEAVMREEDVTLEEDGDEDEAVRLLYEELGTTPSTMEEYLDNDAFFISFFSKVNEVTVSGASTWKQRHWMSALVGELEGAGMLEGVLNTPSLWFFNKDSQTRIMWKRTPEQSKPEKGAFER